MTDRTYGPWPEKDQTWYFTWRRGLWCRAEPWYDAAQVGLTPADVKWTWFMSFWFPFFSVRTSKWYFYTGWKRITLLDPRFPWATRAPWAETYLQCSTSWGTVDPNNPGKVGL